MSFNSKYEGQEIEQLLDIVAGGGGGSSAYPQVNHESASDVVTITPNVLHVWDVVDSLAITFGDMTEGVANEFVFQFKTGEIPPAITLPDGIKWANGETPVFDIYELVQISILNCLGTVARSTYMKINNATMTYVSEHDMLKIEFDYPVASDITCSVVFGNGLELAFTLYEGERYGFAENQFNSGEYYAFDITFSPQQDDMYAYRQGNTEVFIDY